MVRIGELDDEMDVKEALCKNLALGGVVKLMFGVVLGETRDLQNQVSQLVHQAHCAGSAEVTGIRCDKTLNEVVRRLGKRRRQPIIGTKLDQSEQGLKEGVS